MTKARFTEEFKEEAVKQVIETSPDRSDHQSRDHLVIRHHCRIPIRRAAACAGMIFSFLIKVTVNNGTYLGVNIQ
jgi:hypothetical protein